MDSRKKKKTAAIFFDIEKVYNKVNREKRLEQMKTWEYREE